MVPRGGLEPPTHGFSGAPGDPIEAFLNDRRARGLSVRTIQFYSDYLRLLQNHLPEPLLVTSRQQLLSVLLDLSCPQGGKQAYIRAARAFFYWAMDNELIDRNPCQRLRIKSPKPLRYTLSLDALKNLLKGCDTSTQLLTVMLLADTGVRRAELASIKVADIDLDSRTIMIEGKGAKQRRVRFGPVTAIAVADALSGRTDEDRLLGLDASGVSSLLVRLEYRTGMKCNAHSFRRMFACEAIRNGMNLFHVQPLLGAFNTCHDTHLRRAGRV